MRKNYLSFSCFFLYKKPYFYHPLNSSSLSVFHKFTFSCLERMPEMLIKWNAFCCFDSFFGFDEFLWSYHQSCSNGNAKSQTHSSKVERTINVRLRNYHSSSVQDSSHSTVLVDLSSNQLAPPLFMHGLSSKSYNILKQSLSLKCNAVFIVSSVIKLY